MMDAPLWIVAANASRARVWERRDDGEFAEVADLAHPPSRQSGRALGDDRPGRSERDVPGGGRAHNAYAPATDPRHREHERFAREVAAHLDAAVSGRRCGGLVLLAAPAFLGELRAHLGPATARAVLASDDVDATAEAAGELRRRVDALLPPPG